MTSASDLITQGEDPLLTQAEKILHPRLSRALFVDREILGELGWDILLSAYIASRKGAVCSVYIVAIELDISMSIVARWVKLLEAKQLVATKGEIFSITDQGERKLSLLFKGQIEDFVRSVEYYSRIDPPSFRNKG